MKPCIRWRCWSWASSARRCPTRTARRFRLVVPWKYGFKSIKSIAKISLVEKEPPTTWNMTNAREYGFYSNVNPEVDHPRWSQATEERLGELSRRKTLKFNGYGDQVAGHVRLHGPAQELLDRSDHGEVSVQQMDQGGVVSGLHDSFRAPAAAGARRLNRLPDSVAMALPQNNFLLDRAESDRVHHPLHRRLDPALSADHAHRHAAAQSAEPSAVDALPPHAGPVRIFLRDGCI